MSRAQSVATSAPPRPPVKRSPLQSPRSRAPKPARYSRRRRWPLDFVDHVAPLLDEERGVPYALVGGLGLHAYGRSRATFDLDLVTRADAQRPLVARLEELGYQTLHTSPGFSNHTHSDPEWGAIDVMYVDMETARDAPPFSRAL